MMEENNDIFLTGGNALIHLAGTIHKKYSAIFIWGHPYGMFVAIFSLPPPWTHMYAFRVTPLLLT